MVRVKERYLLVSILYPDAPKDSRQSSNAPDLLLLHQPTTDALNAAALARAIRAQVASLFGDYGSGAVERSLVGEHYAFLETQTRLRQEPTSSR